MTTADALLSLLGPRVASDENRASMTAPRSIPDPVTGHPLAVASVDVSDRCVCPRCTASGRGAYVSFVSDLRLAFACSSCLHLVWIAGT